MKQQSLFSLVLAACVLVLAGCAAPTPAPSGTVPPAPDANHRVDFPDMDRAWLKGGTFVDVEQLRRIAPGMTKNQVRELISYPHFDEGLFGPREWNYIFNFRTGKGAEFITCQYMVHFDQDVRAQDFHWKGPNCETLVNPSPVPVIAAPVPAPTPAPAPPRKLSFAADGLFRFDGGQSPDLLPEGKRKIERLAADLRRSGVQRLSITIVGHTDRLGSEAYNDSLSLARANTVRDLLVKEGIAPASIRASGAGERQPVVSCAGDVATPALVRCLQPNRRVDIDVRTEP
jgi:outer membrane protein OmpA-like peptidoglycan-associated protein